MEKAKKRFIVVNGVTVLYLLDNRDGHIKEAEKDVFMCNVSHVDLYELEEMTERDIFMNSSDDYTFITAGEVADV